jgi:hypothetical protein
VPTALPISSTVLYLQPSGIYQETSSGIQGETAVTVPITDAVWFDDMDPNGSETTSDLQSLTQDCYHVLLETLGSNLDDPTRGIGVENALSASSTVLLAMPSQVDAQLLRDDRVQSSTTTLSQTGSLSWSMQTKVVPVGAVLPITYSYSPAQGLQVVPQ